ncbi:Trichosetin synthetase PKS-NRPS1 [Apiospora arundinis]
MHRGAKDTRPSRPSPSPNTTTTSGRDVVAQSTSGVGPAPRDLDSGSLSLQSSTWVNSNHWSVLVDGISDGRESQPASSDTPVGSDNSASPSSPGPKLFYSCPPATRAEIIAALPPRRTSDRLVSSFFNFLDTAAAAIVHSREFLIMYKRLWNDPPSVPITWISILFSVFCIATRFQHAMEFHKDHSIKVKGKLSTETTSNYREKAVQALMLGQYTKGGPYVIEALLLYFTSEHFTNIDAQIESWLILSVTVNIAMRQGYHRDPRHFPQLSPYQGEMRRRVWATLYQVDLSISVQMGLPKLIRDNVSDTQLPGNYAENDFDPSTTQLPMPRPDTEMTPLLYTISKTRLVRVIGMIMEHVTEVQTPSYEDVIRIDAMLDEVYANMPEVFRWEGISESILSSTAIFLFNSLVSHDLFAGALAVCFYLQHHRNSMDPGKLQETKSLLRKSQGLWIEASPTSVEAGKAAEALRIFLNRLDEETLAKQNTEDILSPSELFTSELMPCDVFQDSFWDIRLPFTYFPMDLPGPRPEEPVFLMLDGGQDVGTTESWLASV